MTESILDKVISSKEILEIQAFEPAEIVGKFMVHLSEKEADIIRRRFGLHKNKPETLENIGKRYKVTRERIRQIESLGIKKMMNHPEFRSSVATVEHIFTNAFQKAGGFITEQRLFKKLLGEQKDNYDHERAIIFILSQLLPEKFKLHTTPEKSKNIWKHHTSSEQFLNALLQELHDLMESHGKPMSFDEIFTALTKREVFEHHQEKITDEVVMSFLDISHRISTNPFGEYGFGDWGAIQPRRMNDKIYLILKKENKPLHFTEIADRIGKIFKKKAYPPTVHNELILNAHYILVGRGIYALKEWGYKPGVVSEVIVEILQKFGRPMSREEIADEVLKQRIVKKNTIHLALTNRKTFTKTAEGLYQLN